MVLFDRIKDREVEKIFIDLLNKRVGSGIVKPLFSYFGEDLYLILSILNGTHHHFPSFPTLKSLLSQCEVYKEIEGLIAEGVVLESAIRKTSEKLGLAKTKVKVLYERHLKST